MDRESYENESTQSIVLGVGTHVVGHLHRFGLGAAAFGRANQSDDQR